jgi:peroxiredoxin
LPRLEAQDAVVLVISKYDAEETASWLAENEWTMPFLVDGRPVIELYGILNEEALTNEDHAGIPHPTTVIIDKSGRIQWKQTWMNYRERTSPETMIAILADIND